MMDRVLSVQRNCWTRGLVHYRARWRLYLPGLFAGPTEPSTALPLFARIFCIFIKQTKKANILRGTIHSAENRTEMAKVLGR